MQDNNNLTLKPFYIEFNVCVCTERVSFTLSPSC